MYVLLVIALSVSILLILHTYLFFPAWMMSVYRGRKNNNLTYSPGDALPSVAVLIAAHNEGTVIRQKIESIFKTAYPLSRIKVYVGSDASDDETDQIVSDLQKKHDNLRLVRFNSRAGKISIINHLQSLGDEDILLMTDANVIFAPDTLFELVRYFHDERIGIVAGNIIKRGDDAKGISWQEKKYLTLENKLKEAESNGFGIVMGAEGGCYAIRNSLFSKVPLKFIVDDFFITMQVLLRGYQVIFNPGAVCYEDVPGDQPGEFRRKVRISSGNFQNLMFFRSVLSRLFTPLGFCFWSHKVLRWLTPFLLIISLVCSTLLVWYDQRFVWLVFLQVAGMLLPLIDAVFRFRGNMIKTVSHFYLMNLALLAGFVRFARGIRSSVWQPVRRDV